jgi:hypothetical protein
MMARKRLGSLVCGLLLAGCGSDNLCPDDRIGREVATLNLSSPSSVFVLPDGPWFQSSPFRDVSISNCGQVATVYGAAGTVSVSAAGASVADQSLDVNAVSAAWSNGCDLLAVVTRGPGADRLRITTDKLIQVAEVSIELPAPDEGSPYKRFVVSWSADDALVAVSTDAIRNDNPSSYWSDNVRVAPLCLIVDWADESIRSSQKLHNVYFTGSDTLVGTPPTDSVTQTAAAFFNVHRFTMHGEQLQDEGRVPLAGFAVGSHSVAGLFATIDDVQPIDVLAHRFERLRSISGACRFIGLAYAEDRIVVVDRAPIEDLLLEGL